MTLELKIFGTTAKKKSIYKTYLARKISYITSNNERKRLQFAMEYQNKALCFWNSVLWTDTTRDKTDFNPSDRKSATRR